jgi:hypothetical protein
MTDNSFAVFVVLNIVLLLTVCRHAFYVFKRESKPFLNLSFICSLHVFLGGFLLPNIRYLFEEDWFEFKHLIPNGELYYWLSLSMLSAIIGSLGHSFGYWLNLAEKTGEAFKRNLVSSKVILKDNLPSIVFANSLLFSAALLQVYLFSIGALGYFATTESVQKTSNISQILSVVTSGGRLGLLMLSLRAFGSEVNSWIIRPLLWFWVVVGVVFGITSGFKTQVFFPVATVAVGYYASKRRFPIFHVVMLAVFLLFSFIIVEPLRRLRNQNLLDSTNVREILGTASVILRESLEVGSSGGEFTVYRLLGRLDLANITAVALHFASNENASMDGAPEFGKAILMAPINAIIPRVLWEGKTVVNDGRWFSHHVLGLPRVMETSTGMGPISYLFFLGGWPAIFIGFGLLGFIQRVLNTTFADLGIPGVVLLVCMLPSLALLDSHIGAILTTAIRNFTFLMIACRFFMYNPRDYHQMSDQSTASIIRA